MKTLDDELFDIYCQDGKTVIASLREIYEKGRSDKYQEIISEYMLLTEKQISDIRTDAIEEYSSKLWQVVEKATVNCKLDFTVDDLHNLEIIIKGLAEEMKEGAENEN